MRPSLSAAFLLFASLVAGACQPKVSGADGRELAPDSLRGTVSVTGTSFEKILVLRHAGGSVTLTATPDDSAALLRIGGVDVVARGTRSEGGFTVVSFEVVQVEGKPVIDGLLVENAGRLMLKARGEQLALGNPPVQLRSRIGARIWIGGPLDTGPNTWGLIVPPPPR